MTRKRAWVLSALITASMVVSVLFYGANTGHLGFDDDDAVTNISLTEGVS